MNTLQESLYDVGSVSQALIDAIFTEIISAQYNHGNQLRFMGERKEIYKTDFFAVNATVECYYKNKERILDETYNRVGIEVTCDVIIRNRIKIYIREDFRLIDRLCFFIDVPISTTSDQTLIIGATHFDQDKIDMFSENLLTLIHNHLRTREILDTLIEGVRDSAHHIPQHNCIMSQLTECLIAKITENIQVLPEKKIPDLVLRNGSYIIRIIFHLFDKIESKTIPKDYTIIFQTHIIIRDNKNHGENLYFGPISIKVSNVSESATEIQFISNDNERLRTYATRIAQAIEKYISDLCP